jgi:hypothetical protein
MRGTNTRGSNLASGEVNLMQKVSEDLIMGFNRHKDVKGALSLAQIPVEGESKKVGEGGDLKDGGRRDATKKGSWGRSLADPDGSPRISRPNSVGTSGLGQMSK